jgi:hypothetical protein
MNDLQLPEPEDYRSAIAQAIREARHAIQEVLGYIKRQEDGPVTMTYALRDIDKTVDDIQFEASYLAGESERWRVIAAKALEQRDEALRQRDILLGYLSSGRKRRHRPS